MKPIDGTGVFSRSNFNTGALPVPRDQPGSLHDMGVPMADSQAALARLERDIADRLRHVCSHMPEDDFNAMVRDIAEFKLKYESDEAEIARATESIAQA